MSSIEMKHDKQEVNNEMMKPIEAHVLKKGHFVMLYGHTCKVSQVVYSKAGTYVRKVLVCGYDVLTNTRYEIVKPEHGTVYQPIVNEQEFQLLCIDESDGNSFQVINDKNEQIMVDVLNNQLKRELIDSHKADADGTKDFYVTLLEVPVTTSGKLQMKQSLVSWREVQIDV